MLFDSRSAAIETLDTICTNLFFNLLPSHSPFIFLPSSPKPRNSLKSLNLFAGCDVVVIFGKVRCCHPVKAFNQIFINSSDFGCTRQFNRNYLLLCGELLISCSEKTLPRTSLEDSSRRVGGFPP